MWTGSLMFSGGVVDRPIWVPLLSTFLQTISTWQMYPTMNIPSMCTGNLWNSLLCIASCLKHQHNFVCWVFVVLVLVHLGKKKSWYCALISMIIITSSQKTKYSWQGEFGLHRDLSLVTQFWSQTAQCDLGWGNRIDSFFKSDQNHCAVQLLSAYREGRPDEIKYVVSTSSVIPHLDHMVTLLSALCHVASLDCITQLDGKHWWAKQEKCRVWYLKFFFCYTNSWNAGNPAGKAIAQWEGDSNSWWNRPQWIGWGWS